MLVFFYIDELSIIRINKMNFKKNRLLENFKKSPRYSVKWSNYFNIYEEIFKKYEDKEIVLVEIGVGDGGSLQLEIILIKILE